MVSQLSYKITLAGCKDGEWIVELSSRVQETLTASGSLQKIGPLELSSVQKSIQDGYVFMFEGHQLGGQRRLGAVLIDPFDPSSGHGSLEWGVKKKAGKHWYLHSLMMKPTAQGQGLGLAFLKESISKIGTDQERGTILLDCWAGNEKLRAFYEKSGFKLLGEFPENDYEIAVFYYEMFKVS